MHATKTKRAQILMSPQEYEQLEKIARSQKVSVAELIRKAVQDRYLQTPQKREEILEQMFSLNLPTDDWESLEAEIAAAHSDDFH